MTPIMVPSSGKFMVNDVRVGSWNETAKGVVHVTNIFGAWKQVQTLADAEAYVHQGWEDWLKASRLQPAPGDA